ncbi:MAG: QacE family quaternary ammonium compound efflux SMR transporter [Candidatus Riflebacteria bacterium HGW-Riflebacteria-2]|nr:MAG: QacE family quaternary ammonium compound efflux SMR transporter [Candidatus Riflebacteria bacterium HGW-Riflebacteria-2]
MPWLILVIAGFCEIFWALGLKSSDGFARFWPSVFTVVTLALSLYLLAMALRNIPISTAYSVWTGIGATGTAIAGILLFNEPVSLAKVGCLLLIIGGVVGLRVLG